MHHLVAAGAERTVFLDLRQVPPAAAALRIVGPFDVGKFLFGPGRNVFVVLQDPQWQVREAVLAQGVIVRWWLRHGWNVMDNTDGKLTPTGGGRSPR